MADSIGIDIVDVNRIRTSIERFGSRFIERILGPEELSRLGDRRDRATFVAGRFAAKEALVKALGKYLSDRPPWPQLQVVNDSGGEPRVKLPDHLSKTLAGVEMQVSISHEKNYAVAMAILSEKK